MVRSLRQSAPAPLPCRSSSAGLLLQGRKNRRDARMNESTDPHRKSIKYLEFSKINRIFAAIIHDIRIDMGNNVGTKETLITTNEGLRLIRRERTVKMPNGKLRHPVDYYDATPGAVEVTPEERERIRIPVYKMLI